MPFEQFGEEAGEDLFTLGEFPASEAVDLVAGQAKPPLLGDHLRLQLRGGSVGDPALYVGRVLAAVVLDTVHFDDDAGAVRWLCA